MTLRDELDALKAKAMPWRINENDISGWRDVEFVDIQSSERISDISESSTVAEDVEEADARFIVALVNAYSRGDLIPADEVMDDDERLAVAVAIVQATTSDEVRELWEAADEHLNYWHELSKNGDYHRRFRVAIEALRERMER